MTSQWRSCLCQFCYVHVQIPRRVKFHEQRFQGFCIRGPRGISLGRFPVFHAPSQHRTSTLCRCWQTWVCFRLKHQFRLSPWKSGNCSSRFPSSPHVPQTCPCCRSFRRNNKGPSSARLVSQEKMTFWWGFCFLSEDSIVHWSSSCRTRLWLHK